MPEQTQSQNPPAAFLTLADKLNALELTVEEEQALGVVLGAPQTLATDESEAETQGFGWEEGVAAVVGSPRLPIRGFNIGMPPTTRISAELGASFVNEKL